MTAQQLLEKLQELSQTEDLKDISVVVSYVTYDSSIQYDRGYTEEVYPDELEVYGNQLVLS